MPVDFDAMDSLDDDQQTAGTEEDAHEAQIENRLKDLHTSLPGLIVSFDAVKQTAVVQLVTKRVFADGPQNLPLCNDVPVIFPRGGGLILTFPIKKGDECLVWFTERDFDYWFKQGTIQLPSDYLMHDLSCGICMVGVSSQPNKIANLDTEQAQLRTADGSTSVSVNPNGTITLKGNVVITGTLDTKGEATFEEAVAVEGALAAEAGITVTGSAKGSGGNLEIDGAIVATGEGTFADHTVGAHTHGGVAAGSGESGPPVG